MKKLLLTSNGFANPKISKRFLELVGKNPASIKVLFITTASTNEDEKFYVNESEKELISLGIPKENITWLNSLEDDVDVNSYDVVYVCGGNTFFLMHEIRRTGFDKKITEFINSGKVYVGVSAGSVIMGLSVLHAKNFDKNYIGLKDMTGFNMVDKIIAPHHKPEEEEIAKKFEQENNCQIFRLPDGQAIELADNTLKIIE